ncbi:MerR family transcriptional regulator [Bradyrhizobium sp. WD16]|uniref:MerR family transcriptional regulator n=1 Tax=Bradyrhizobium sp. WD16 TaxID=1521768 RepID=UPI0020A55AB0|nr:MerR family transcriptional regulator [Bradyrhizobium sp. WD16]UTD29510.1 MerR family transcriptional regulator [Bradyrhizobium sp. WD16]
MMIQEAARRLGVSARTLRHYEAAGLIRPARLANGYRNLSDADLRTAEWIRGLVAAGFSLRELRALSAALDQGRDRPTCVAALRDKLDQIDRLAERLQQRRQAVIKRLAVQERMARDAAPRPQEVSNHEGSQHSGAALSAARPLRRRRRLP